MKGPRVAVIGTRGIPGVHGGVERHCEELYPRLAQLGFAVTVFARRGYVDRDCVYRGVSVRTLAALPGRPTEALSHTANALLHAVADRFDLIHFHSIGPASLVPLARSLTPAPVILTVHALDYRQVKWGAAARAYLRFGEWAGMRCASRVIAVARVNADYLHTRYHRPVALIPNGPGEAVRRSPGPMLASLGLSGQDYVLFVGRLIPDKRVEDLIVAARAVPQLRVVIAGDSSHTDEYVEALREIAGPQILFPGYVHGQDLQELYSCAAAFILPSAVEGQSISLLEAMAHGCPAVVTDIPENLDVVTDPTGTDAARSVALVYPLGDTAALAHHLATLLEERELGRRLARAALDVVRKRYDWDAIAAATCEVYESALR